MPAISRTAGTTAISGPGSAAVAGGCAAATGGIIELFAETDEQVRPVDLVNSNVLFVDTVLSVVVHHHWFIVVVDDRFIIVVDYYNSVIAEWVALIADCGALVVDYDTLVELIDDCIALVPYTDAAVAKCGTVIPDFVTFVAECVAVATVSLIYVCTAVIDVDGCTVLRKFGPNNISVVFRLDGNFTLEGLHLAVLLIIVQIHNFFFKRIKNIR